MRAGPAGGPLPLAASVDLARDLDLLPALANGLNNLAAVLRGLSDYAPAAEPLEDSGELARTLGAERFEAAVLSNRSQLARLTDDPEGALHLVLRSLDTSTRVGFLDGQLDGAEAVAMAWVALGRHADGLVVLGVHGPPARARLDLRLRPGRGGHAGVRRGAGAGGAGPAGAAGVPAAWSGARPG